jgi:type IX secretion system PorP/SprF family membrane protein
VLAIFVFPTGIQAQHYSLFSQYVVNGLVINPAYAGKNDVLDITLLNRRQWAGFKGAPFTTSFSANTPLRKPSSNVGFIYQSDKLGNFRSHLLSGIYAYRINFGGVKLSFGMQGGWKCDVSSSEEQLKCNDAGDVVLENLTRNRHEIFAGAGIYVHSENYFFGISKPWLYQTSSGTKFNPLLISGGAVVKLKNNHEVKPSFMLRYVVNSPLQFDLGFNYYYQSRFGVGFAVRAEESFIFLAEYLLNDQFKMAISYDAGRGSLSGNHVGSTEFMLRYFFGFTREARNPRAFVF